MIAIDVPRPQKMPMLTVVKVTAMQVTIHRKASYRDMRITLIKSRTKISEGIIATIMIELKVAYKISKLAFSK